MIIFVTCLVLFAAASLPLKSHAAFKRIGYDPAKLLRLEIILLSLLWMLPLFGKTGEIEYGWYSFYFLAALTSIAFWSLGTRLKLPRPAPLVSAETAKKALVAASLPFVFYYVATGTLLDQLNSIANLSIYQLRTNHWQNFGGSGDAFLFLASCAAYPAALLWPISKPRSGVFFFSLFVFALFAITAIAGGSRMVLVFSIAISLLLWHSKHPIKPLTLLRTRPFFSISAVAAGLGALYYIFYFVLAERVPGLSSQYDLLSRVIVGAKPTDLMVRINEWTGGVAGVVAISVSYFSSTLTFFESFMRDSTQCNCSPQYGVYNFPFLDNLIGGDWFEIRTQIAYFWASRGTGQNPWASSYRDFFIDFGLIGSLIFNAVVFASLGALAGSAATKRDDLSKLVVAYISAFVLITPLLSPLLILVISLPLYGLLMGSAFVAPNTRSLLRRGSSAATRQSNFSGTLVK